MRVSARLHDALTPQPVTLTGAYSEGKALPLSVEGDTPALVRTTSTGKPLSLGIGSPRVVTLDLAPVAIAPTTTPRPAPPTRLGDYHLDLIPSGGDLIAGLHNRVFVRLLDRELRPMAATRLTISHRALPGGQKTLETDRHGLAEFTVLADRPNIDLRVVVETPTGSIAHTQTFRPVGRELTLEVTPRARPGSVLRAHVATLRTRGALSCELLRQTAEGPVWVFALDRQLEAPRFELEIPLPALPIGTRLDLQCGLTPGVGIASASRPIWLGEPDNAPGSRSRPSEWNSLSQALAQTLEAAPRRAPVTHLRTRDTDRAAFEKAHAGTRTLLMVALIGVLSALLILALSAIALHIRRTRRHMSQALDEDTTLTATERHDITRTRGLFYLAAGVALAIGWIAAVGALLA